MFNGAQQVNSGTLRGPVGDYAKTDADRVLRLDAISSVVGETNVQLSEQIVSLRDMLDSVLGAEPSGESNGKAATPNMGRLDGLRCHTEDTRSLVDLLRGQINRLRQL